MLRPALSLNPVHPFDTYKYVITIFFLVFIISSSLIISFYYFPIVHVSFIIIIVQYCE